MGAVLADDFICDRSTLKAHPALFALVERPRPGCRTAGLLASTSALAAWPEKPIRIVVTFAAGGASDIVARAVSEPLAKALDPPMIVDNKPGAGGTIGGTEVVRAAPDGYSLILANSTPLSMGPWTVPTLPYVPCKNFTHIAMLGIAPVVIMVNPKSGPASLKDLSRADATPGYVFGSGGPGSIGHIVGEMMKPALHVQMTHVPYRGGAPMTTDLIAGTIPLGIDVLSAFVPTIRSGQIRALAVTTRQRSPLLPEVPTVMELGFLQLLAENYFGVSGPAAQRGGGQAVSRPERDHRPARNRQALRRTSGDRRAHEPGRVQRLRQPPDRRLGTGDLGGRPEALRPWLAAGIWRRLYTLLRCCAV